MNEINNSVFREGLDDEFPVFQDGDQALTVALACQIWRSRLETFIAQYHRFKTNFLLLLDKDFW